MPPPIAPSLRRDRSFERLYRRHAAGVYRYALAMLRNRADAEDVTQTTFLNAYRVYQRGERPRAASSWLMAIAHNACVQRFRELQRRPDEVSLDESAAVSPSADDEVPRVEDIQRALANLAFNQRAALVMRELQGRAYAEIGEVLGLSTSAVEALVFRARRALREQLEGSLTCAEAEGAIFRQLDQRLPRSEKGFLRAHLRECAECSSLARRERARRAALRGLAAIPLPHSLASFFGGGGAAGGGVALKAAAVVAAGAVVGGTGYEAVEHAPWRAAQGVPAPSPGTASPRAGGGSQSDATALPTGARLIVGTPAREPITVRAQPLRRAAAKPAAVKTAAPAAVVEAAATPARPESPRARSRSGAARGPTAKNPRSRANGRAQGPQAGRVRPSRADALGQTKTKPKPKAKTAARNGAPQKVERGPGKVGAPSVAAAPAQPPASEQTIPLGQAKKDGASPGDTPPGQETKADKDATTGASDPQGQERQKD
jgi:RNA polymerase sigma-70 factor (ECF subfamily)